jgi:hypothetical protein
MRRQLTIFFFFQVWFAAIYNVVIQYFYVHCFSRFAILVYWLLNYWLSSVGLIMEYWRYTNNFFFFSSLICSHVQCRPVLFCDLIEHKLCINDQVTDTGSQIAAIFCNLLHDLIIHSNRVDILIIIFLYNTNKTH